MAHEDTSDEVELVGEEAKERPDLRSKCARVKLAPVSNHGIQSSPAELWKTYGAAQDNER